MAYTLQTGREAMEERLTFVANNIIETIDGLNTYLKGDKKEILKGNTKNDTTDFLLEGEAGKGYIEIAIRNKEAKSLAQLWVKGVEIDWSLLYEEGHQPDKISLPTYPFARERYWIPEIEGTSSLNSPKSKLHPLLHSNKSDLSEQKYESIFTGNINEASHIIQSKTPKTKGCYSKSFRVLWQTP